MSDRRESPLPSLWWWKPNASAAIGKELEPAAFAYEVVARVSCHYAQFVTPIHPQGKPIYPLEKPFVELTQAERFDVQSQMEDAGCILPPKHPIIFPMAGCDSDEDPPAGWMRFAFAFDPEHMAAGDVAKLVEKHVKDEAKRRGVALLKGSTGRRNKPWPWETLEKLDRILAGKKLASYDRQTARNLLTRHMELWPQWYLSKNDPQVWNRPDARGFRLVCESRKQ